MKIRIITSIVALLLFAIILIAPQYIFAIAFFIVSIVALKEFHNAIDKKGNRPFVVLNFIASAFILVSMSISLMDMSKNTFYKILVIFMYSLPVIYTGYGIIRHSKYTLTDIIINYFSIIYIVIPMASLVFIRSYEYGIYNIMYIFIGAWVTDTFAYFTGRLLGKRKLIKSLSPKKTIAGSVGGTIGCVVFVVAYGVYLNYNIYVTEISYLYIIILGLVLGGVSQLGDLFASYIKREAGIKDFGKIMPGHGGVLDRFDSILMSIPVVTIFVILLF